MCLPLNIALKELLDFKLNPNFRFSVRKIISLEKNYANKMELKELRDKASNIINDLKDKGVFPKENNHIDYKKELNINPNKDCQENFLCNFVKDIISFSNAEGGIILIGIEEDKITGLHNDIGLNAENLELLTKIDLNLISQKFEKITKVGISIDLQLFQISTRKFYSLLIEKQNNVLVPIGDFTEYKIAKGDVIYRASGKNEIANSTTADFNRFLQMKANEKSKEFMEIWSKLLPEMVDINPREVLILNPMQNRVYGFNSRDNILSGSDVEIDKTESGVFKIILNAISAGEIGKITTNEGKPLYKIVGEFQGSREHILLNSLDNKVRELISYKITNQKIKDIINYLGWVCDAQFKVDNPPEGTVKPEYDKFIWVENLDDLSGRTKVFFSTEAIDKIVEVIQDETIHEKIFLKKLDKKSKQKE